MEGGGCSYRWKNSPGVENSTCKHSDVRTPRARGPGSGDTVRTQNEQKPLHTGPQGQVNILSFFLRAEGVANLTENADSVSWPVTRLCSLSCPIMWHFINYLPSVTLCLSCSSPLGDKVLLIQTGNLRFRDVNNLPKNARWARVGRVGHCVYILTTLPRPVMQRVY